jgi:ribonucleoside-diphosphate reductase alpha chain
MAKNINSGKRFLSNLKLYSDYFKWKDNLGRYENWDEACEDIINGHRIKYAESFIEPELESVLESLKSQTILASQRNLQFRYPQLKQHNSRIFNCTVVHVCRPEVFQEVFYLGLCGCGVGASLLLPFVNCLPKIQLRSLGTKTFIVEDSIEGWADALGVLMSSYMQDNQPQGFSEYAGYEIKFDYSQIRENGAYINGGFKAPGPEGLKNSLEKIEKILEQWIRNEGDTIRPILAYDIICHASDAVLSGGVRRSALSMIVDPNDEEMILAKTGTWRQDNPQRARSNNSVLIPRKSGTREFFDKIVNLNYGDNDIGFVFCNTWFDVFNPCFEIGFTPVDTYEDLTKIDYDQLQDWTMENQELFGIQMCNLNEINAEKCQTEEQFLRACKDAAILGTLQAGYTDFPYLGNRTESLVRREALLGISVTGWMNNPKLFNPELLRKGAQIVIDANKDLAKKIGINQAARTTCVKPSGNASVVLGTASGIHPEHSERYFRIMQLNKFSDTAAWLTQHMPFLLEESVWSANKTDYVVFVPITNPKDGLFKKDMKGVKHLELIRMVQQNWIVPGTVRELGICPETVHNCSCTVIIDNQQDIINYIWDNRTDFTAISFISDYGDKDFNQAPFTSVLTAEEIFAEYGKAALFASGLIVDGLHYFDNNLWQACDSMLNKDIPITGTREQVMLKKYWLKRAQQFAKNYFKNDLRRMVYCLKEVHLCHKWETISRQMREVDFGDILKKPEFKNVSEYGAMSCSGGACEITRI